MKSASKPRTRSACRWGVVGGGGLQVVAFRAAARIAVARLRVLSGGGTKRHSPLRQSTGGGAGCPPPPHIGRSRRPLSSDAIRRWAVAVDGGRLVAPLAAPQRRLEGLGPLAQGGHDVAVRRVALVCDARGPGTFAQPPGRCHAPALQAPGGGVPPPPLYKLRQCAQLLRSLRLS